MFASVVGFFFGEHDMRPLFFFSWSSPFGFILNICMYYALESQLLHIIRTNRWYIVLRHARITLVYWFSSTQIFGRSLRPNQRLVKNWWLLSSCMCTYICVDKKNPHCIPIHESIHLSIDLYTCLRIHPSIVLTLITSPPPHHVILMDASIKYTDDTAGLSAITMGPHFCSIDTTRDPIVAVDTLCTWNSFWHAIGTHIEQLNRSHKNIKNY